MVEERVARAYLTLGHFLRNEIDRLEEEYENLIILIQSETTDKILDILKIQLTEKNIELGTIKRINSLIDAEQKTILQLFDTKEKMEKDEE